MASSRLEKVGTIFSRIKGLLRSGAMKEEDKPIWYDVYKAFPPKYEPRYDRPAPDTPIRQIFYPEDIIRAKYHKENKSLPAVNLIDERTKTNTQKFISIYQKLKEEDKLGEEELYIAAIDVMKTERSIAREKRSASEARQNISTESNIASSFKEAQKEELKKRVNVEDIFKE